MLVEEGKIVDGKVSVITKFGAFVQLPEGKNGLVHISEISEHYVKDVREHLTENQEVKVKILSIDPNGKISLSIRKAVPKKIQKEPQKSSEDVGKVKEPQVLSFEDRLAKFMKDSDERQHDLKRSFENKRGTTGPRKSARR
ncbi:MAG: S1 RNA-binding domain-containing protein [Clostridiales bacterium]|nr:S1 RNA-binding domain-containing protein [Clostridiales bacterium]